MIPDDQGVTLRRVGGHRPDRKVSQGIRIAGVSFFQLFDFFRIDTQQIGVAVDEETARVGPVAIGIVKPVGAVHLHDDIHARLAARELHFVQVAQRVLLKIVIGSHVDHKRPLGNGLLRFGAGDRRGRIAIRSLLHQPIQIRLPRQIGDALRRCPRLRVSRRRAGLRGRQRMSEQK